MDSMSPEVSRIPETNFAMEMGMQLLRRFLGNDEGATSVEYAFLASLVAMAAAAGISTLGDALTVQFQSIAAAFPS